MTLLLPRDEHGVLGHEMLHLRPEEAGSQRSGFTLGQVLWAIHSHYQLPLSTDDQLWVMRQDKRLRRALQVGRRSWECTIGSARFSRPHGKPA